MHGLEDEGIRCGDLVLIALPDSIQFVTVFLACMKLGAIAVPVSNYHREDEYLQILGHLQPKLILAEQSNQAVTLAAVRHQGARLVSLSVDAEEYDSWDSWQTGPKSLRGSTAAEDQVSFLLWTSGTTGHAIPVPHKKSDWLICCSNYGEKILGMSRHDTFLSTSRMYHAYGLGNSLFFPLYAGARSILITERPVPRGSLQLAQKMKVTLLFSVPTFFSLMLRCSEKDHSLQLPQLRLAISAAEPLAPRIYNEWPQRFGGEILDGMGSTEALHIYLSARPGAHRPGSVGRLVEGYQAQIRDAEEMDAQRTVGNLWLKGPSLAEKYWKNDEATERHMRGGWFDTGDKCSVDEDGYYYFHGRSDSMFRISGQWVSAVEVEAALSGVEGVRELAIGMCLDEEGLSKLCLYMVLDETTESTTPVIESLKLAASERLPVRKRPIRFQVLAELPRTASGKIQRHRLQLKA